MRISDIKAYQIYDSRGYPTIACWLEINKEFSGLAKVPSGASTGTREAVELRDLGPDWNGKGVLTAIHYINTEIRDALIGLDPCDQKEIDQILIKIDGTKNKSRLGANAILAVSLANAIATAKATNTPLPIYIRKHLINDKNDQYHFPLPMVNVINGGRHANNNCDFQEFMFVVLKCNNWNQCLKIADECFLALQNLLASQNLSIAKGDEGGFSINLNSLDDYFEYLLAAIHKAGYTPGVDVGIGLDIAASEFYEDGKYSLRLLQKKITSLQLLKLYEELINKYPLVSLEDPFHEDDWEAFEKITKKYGHKLLIVGDDLYCTNPLLLQKGIDQKATNAILIKLNQIGTLTECLETIRMARKNHIAYIISHRSGETEDSFIADFAIATHAHYLKTGSMSRSERLAKYNRICEIDNLIVPLASPLRKKD